MSNGRLYLPLDDIHVDEDRIRSETYNVPAKVKSLKRFGQLQPVLVEAHGGPKPWKLVDGGQRYAAMQVITMEASLDEDLAAELTSKGIRPGFIEATTREALDPLEAKLMEFYANEDRDNFSFEEKKKFVREVHDLLTARHGKEWTQEKTAEVVMLSPKQVSVYLMVTSQHPAAQHESVKNAKTLREAQKKFQIQRERHLRQQAALLEQQRMMAIAKEKPEVAQIDYHAIARRIVYHGDARDWIKNIPANALDWFHWDPPYGTREGAGGAFSAHEAIDTDPVYCLSLMQDMIPEIWRVLKDGSWLVMWYSPVHYNWLRLALQGHRFDEETATCVYCDRHIIKDYIWLSENYSCRKSPHRFWVNPFPNVWEKTDRAADGHEITRFLTKKTEPFLLAGKNLDRMPILERSDRDNLFKFDNVSRTERRHVNHKNPALLTEILSLISIPGSIGGDAGAGSGSIIEAAFDSGRKIVCAEIREDHHIDCVNITVEKLKEREIRHPAKIADWLVPDITSGNFTKEPS